MRVKDTILFIVFVLQIFIAAGQTNPFLLMDSTKAFKDGETLNYYASYSNKVLSMNMADAELRVNSDSINGGKCLKITASGTTRAFYSVFFSVNDIYTSYLDPETLRPLKATSNQREGGYKYESDFSFNWNSNTVYTVGHNIKRDWYYKKTLELGPFSYDGLTLFYNLRAADFSQIKSVGDSFDVSLVLEDTVRTLHLKFLGRENQKASKKLGSFRTLKFSCVFATSTDTSFQDGTEFFVWITDDKNKVPVYLESPLQVGKIYVTLSGYSNLANPVTSKTTM